MSPAKYFPNHELLHKKSPFTMITPHKISQPHNSGSLNKYIEGFIHDVVDTSSHEQHYATKIIDTMNKTKVVEPKILNKNDLNSSIIKNMSSHLSNAMDTHVKQRDKETDDSFYIEVNDYNSIALNTAPIDSNIKMRSPFVSKTERYPQIKPSPGPGSYNLIKETESKNEMKVSPQAFGSTYKYRTHFLNVEKTPFGKPSYLDNPGVGHYYNTKKIPKRIESEILKAQQEREQEEGFINKPGFLGSSQRPCLAEVQESEVGPGKYEIEIKEGEKDVASPSFRKQKGKDSLSVFISTSPRFKDMTGPPGLNTTKAEQKQEDFEALKSSQRKTATRILSQARQIKQDNFDQVLKKEKSKQSFMFQSKSRRFVTPRPLRVEDLSEEEFKQLANNAALFGPHVKNLLVPNKEIKDNAAIYTAYATIGKQSIPFNSNSLRFTGMLFN